MIPGPSPFRIYPTKAAGTQRFASPQAVCQACLSGTCCSSEDPIYLTAFDILRLSAYFDLSPAQWMLRFTQDRFEGEDSQLRRRSAIDDPESSVVTYLRRRANYPTSPCLFLRYIREPDGTPRRVCGVHPARPLSCREYYFDTCQTRWTGEIAALQAHGFELVRDGGITAGTVDAALAQLEPVDPAAATMSVQLEYAFWMEMQRALDVDAANNEGAHSFDLAAYQDPIDAKLNRMLSSAWLRLEEKYGPIPWGEQLHAYDAGLSFAGTPEHARLLRLAEPRPPLAPDLASDPHPLFRRGDYPHYVASRAALMDLPAGLRFRSLTADAIARLTSKAAAKHRPMLHAALRASEALVRFVAFAAAANPLLEQEPAGTLEREILFALSRIEAAAHPCWKLHPGLRQSARWAARKATLPAAWKNRLRPPRPASSARIRQWLATQSIHGTWHTDPSPGDGWPESQAAYWRSLLQTTAAGIVALKARD